MVSIWPADNARCIVDQQCAAQHQYMQAADEGRRGSGNKPLCSHAQTCGTAGGEQAGVKKEVDKADDKLHHAKITSLSSGIRPS